MFIIDYDVKQERISSTKIKDLKRKRAVYELCADMLIDLKNGYNPNMPDGMQPKSDMLIALKHYAFLIKKKAIFKTKIIQYLSCNN
jgi:hypothetical protein